MRLLTLMMLTLFSFAYSQNFEYKQLDTDVTVIRFNHINKDWNCFDDKTYRKITAGLVEREALLRKDSITRIQDSLQKSMSSQCEALVLRAKDTIISRDNRINSLIDKNVELRVQLESTRKWALILFLVGFGLGFGSTSL